MTQPSASTKSKDGSPHALPVEYLRDVSHASNSCLQESTTEQGELLGELTQLDSDLGSWISELRSRPEAPQLKYGHLQFGSSIYLAYSGLYAQAYASLRTFLELSFAAVHFSSNELDRRKWMSGRIDFSWSAALDRENGLLSTGFVREFNPPAIEDGPDFANTAAKCYRECSEFIHGKHLVTANLPETISYSADTLESWIISAKDSAISTLFLLFVRYGHELIDPDRGNRLDEILNSWFPERKSVQRSLESLLIPKVSEACR